MKSQGAIFSSPCPFCQDRQDHWHIFLRILCLRTPTAVNQVHNWEFEKPRWEVWIASSFHFKLFVCSLRWGWKRDFWRIGCGNYTVRTYKQRSKWYQLELGLQSRTFLIPTMHRRGTDGESWGNILIPLDILLTGLTEACSCNRDCIITSLDANI